MSEADAKYRKLATEYAKLKAQLPVLRKAIIEEQQKEGVLKDELKEKDQTIRKSEQELESLLFRNEQLSKRVSVLQGELERASASSSKRRGRADTSGDNSGSNVLLNEELQRKIRENERLHSELSQIKQDTDGQMMILRDKLDNLEFSEKQHSTSTEKMADEHKSQLDKLREEKALLEVRVETQERTVREAKLAASLAEDKLQHIERAISSELLQAKKTIEEKIPFNDIKCTTMNSFNVPTHNRRYHIQVSEQLRQINSYTTSLCEHLSNVFTYLEQRYRVYPSPTSNSTLANVNNKLCAHLKNAPAILRLLSEAFRKFTENQPADVVLALDTATHLEPFTQQFSTFTNFVKKLTPYLTLSLNEESLLPLSTQTMSDQNEKTTLALQQFSNSLDRTSSYLCLLTAQSTRPLDHPKRNQSKMLDLLTQSISHLHLTSKELGIAYNMKSQLETQLPTVTDSLSSTDQCLINAFISTSATLAKLSTFVTEHYDSSSGQILQLPISGTEKHDPIVTQLQSQSSGYLRLIQRPVAPSVRYEVSLENMKTLFSSTESRESLHEQVTKLNNKSSKLEQEKEHWMLEAQLLRIKFDKQQKLLSASPSPVTVRAPQSAGESPATSAEDRVRSSSTVDDLVKVTDELGEVKHSVVVGDTDQVTRESLLKAHLSKRIDDLTTQLQLADSKAVAFHAECRALGKRLRISNKVRLKAQDELTQANSTISHLQDELLTTKKSYDAQLMTMSEALASMNGNLASQQDEIEELKQQLRMAKKGKK